VNPVEPRFAASRSSGLDDESRATARLSRGADDGTRTHALLHGTL